MASTGVVDIFLVYQFLRRLATPFEKWEAFKTGVIDKQGKILVGKRDRDFQQKQSFKVFDVMILKLKRLLGKVPMGKSRIASKSEEQILTENVDYLAYINDIRNERFIKFRQFIEDAPTNATGAAVVGTGDTGISWMTKRKQKKMVRRQRVS